MPFKAQNDYIFLNVGGHGHFGPSWLRLCHHATYYSCSYVVNFIHEYFMETDLHFRIS